MSAAVVEGSLVEGDVRIEDGTVAEVGVAPAGDGGIAAPGFVDLHINGVAGVDFLTADAAGYRDAAEALARTGVVAFQPTFVSAPLESYPPALATAGEAQAQTRGRGASRAWSACTSRARSCPRSGPGRTTRPYLLAPDPEAARATARRGAGDHGHPRPRAAGRPRAPRPHGGRRRRRLARPLRRRRAHRPRRLRPRRPGDHPHLQRPAPLAPARSRACGSGAGAPGRVRRGDRRRRPPRARGGLRDLPGHRRALLSDHRRGGGGDGRARQLRRSAAARSRSPTARCGWPTARSRAAC